MSNQKQAKQRKEGRTSSLERFLEWQEKQYVSGYYTGGRIPPIFYGKRPNKFGYLLLLTGGLTLVAVLVAVWSAFTAGWPSDPETRILLPALLSILQILSGWRLLQRPKVGKKEH
jgi:hypothetical protein